MELRLLEIHRHTDATEPSTDADETLGSTKSRRTKLLQGAMVFVIMFVTLWWVLSRNQRTE